MAIVLTFKHGPTGPAAQSAVAVFPEGTLMEHAEAILRRNYREPRCAQVLQPAQEEAFLRRMFGTVGLRVEEGMS